MQGTIFRRAMWFLLPLILSGCGNPEVLMPKSASVPADVDLSGQWKIRPQSSHDQSGLREAIDRTDGVEDRSVIREMRDRRRNAREGQRRSGRMKGGLVHVFLKTGDSLKITQTAHALFISFDRAVVEEYRFGEDRPVSIGDADAHRVSGWEGGSYVIETLGEKGMKLTDRYSLSEDDERLVRRITFRSRNQEEVTLIQEFDRQGG